MSEGSPPPRKKRLWLRWLIAIVSILAVAVFLFFRDEELKPMDDLLPQRPDAAWDDNNGWKRLYDFAAKITPLEKKTQSPKLSRIIGLEEEAHPAEWQALELSEADLTEMESIAAMPVFQDVRYETLAATHGKDMTRVLSAAKRLQVNLATAIETGQHTPALRCLRLMAQITRRQMTGSTTEFDCVVGEQWLSRHVVIYALVRGEWGEPDLKSIAALLDGDEVTLDERHTVMRDEFAMNRGTVLGSPGLPYESTKMKTLQKLYYQKNSTANFLAKQTRAALRRTLVAPWPEVVRYAENAGASDDWTSWLDPNRFGKELVNDYLTPGALEYKWRNSIGIRRALQVIIALHRYQKARGSLPARLEELVPDFLPAIPIGPYHFDPFHWDPKNRAVQFLGSQSTLAKTVANPKELIDTNDDHFTVYFRTKTEDAARRAHLLSAPPPKSTRPKKPLKPDKPIPTH